MSQDPLPPSKINFKATLKKAGSAYTRTTIAKEMGRAWYTVHKWYKGMPIPKTANDRLISYFRQRGIEPVLKA